MIIIICLMVSMFVNSETFALQTPTIKIQLKAALTSNNSNDSTNSLIDKNNEKRSKRFSWDYARFTIRGQINEKLSYLSKFRLNGNMSNNSDSMGKWVDYAYIDHELTHNLKFRIGKQKVKYGGWEGTYALIDLYGATSDIRSFKSELGYLDEYFVTGMGIIWQGSIGLIEIQVADPDSKNKDDNSDGVISGVRWEGRSFNNTLNPIITYHQMQKTKQVDATGKVTEEATIRSIKAIGLQYKKANFKIELDWIESISPSVDPTGVGKADKLQSSVFRISKMMSNWRPVFKISKNKFDDELGTAKTTSYTGMMYSFAFEYYPMDKINFNYYLGQNLETKEFIDANTDSITSSQTYVGFRGTF